jgi:hypothetical protein
MEGMKFYGKARIRSFARADETISPNRNIVSCLDLLPQPNPVPRENQLEIIKYS